MKYNEIINSLVKNADRVYTKPDKVTDPNLQIDMLNLRDSMRESVRLFEQLVENSLKQIPNSNLVFANPSGTRFLDGSATKIRNYLWIQLKEERWKGSSISISVFATKDFFRITTERVDKDVTKEEVAKYNTIFDTPLNDNEFGYFFPSENRYCSYDEVAEKSKVHKFQISKSIKKNEILSDEQLETKIAESIFFLTPIYQGILAGNTPIVSNIGSENLVDKSADQTQDKQETIMMQKIFFGAPGTGKSFKVNSILPNEDIWSVSGEIRKQLFLDSDTAKKAHYAAVLDNKEKFGDIWNVNELSVLEEKLSEVNSVDNVGNPEHSALQAYIKFLKEYKFERVFRTTFHPDYDYAQFVGAYKPKKEGNAITYSFVPQVFTKAYAAAWKQYFAAGNVSTADNQVYLVIEEINRGNCAQIFGDIFQLLDRDGEGFSQYSIDADCDFAEWLKENGIGDGKLKLPPNMNILATMNTSDQSLFPMDSAFKRRFDWEYVPISFTDEEGNEKEAAKYEIDIPDANGKNYLWKNFVETVNAKILDLTESEDKQLGEFFIKPDSGNVISKERFLGKVMFYLWNEVCKDEHKNDSFFKMEDGSYFTFQDLYKNKALLKQFMDEFLAPKT